LHRPDQRLDTADLDRRRRAGAGVADLGGTDRIGRHRVATVGNEQSHRFAEERLEGQGEPRRRRRAEPDVEVAGGDAAGDGVGAADGDRQPHLRPLPAVADEDRWQAAAGDRLDRPDPDVAGLARRQVGHRLSHCLHAREDRPGLLMKGASGLGQAAAALHAYVLALAPAELRQVHLGSATPEPDGADRAGIARTSEPRAHLDWLAGILTESFRHTGELEALNAIRRRAEVGTRPTSARSPHRRVLCDPVGQSVPTGRSREPTPCGKC
jgi:hypothetical protein